MYMRSRLAIAIVAASLLVPADAFAQRHGGGGARMGGGGFRGAPGGMAVRGGPGFHGTGRGFAPGFASRGFAPRRFTAFRGERFRRFDGDFDFDDGFGFRHHHNRFFFNAGFGYAYYPYAYAYPAYPAYADYDAYAPRSYAYSDTAGTSAVSDAYAQGALQQQIADLQSEVHEMRSELHEQRPAPSAPRPTTAAEAPPVTLVYRDGRRVEASNYAIAGNTFWIVSERTARKVAMSDLDLAATKRVNEQNGVELDWLRGR